MKNLFIIGSPRSGTTFLASLLKPTEYGEPFETQFILKFAEKYASYGDLNQLNNLQRLIDDISAERAIAQWKVPVSAEKMLSDFDGEVTFIDVIDYVCCQLMATRGKEFWGDKTPHYILALPKLVSLYPKAKYLYIVRDGRDVALSLFQKGWGPNNAYAAAQQWHAANNEHQLELIRQLERDGRLLYIKYEELLDNPKEECSKIYNFLDDDIENYSDVVNELINKTITGNYFKWKNKMTEQQISTYDAIAKTTLAAHNYEFNSQAKQPSFVLAKYYKLEDFLLWAKHMFVQNVIDTIKIKFFGKQPFDQ